MRTLALAALCVFLGVGYGLGVIALRALVVFLESTPIN